MSPWLSRHLSCVAFTIAASAVGAASASPDSTSTVRVVIISRGVDDLGATTAPVVRDRLAELARKQGWIVTDLETLRLDAGAASDLLVPLREAGVQLALDAAVSAEVLGTSDLDRRYSSVEAVVFLKAHAPQTSDVVYEREWRGTAVDVTAKTAARKAIGVALDGLRADELSGIARRLQESAMSLALCGIEGNNRALVEEIVGRFRPPGAAMVAEFRAGCWQVRFPVGAALDGLKVASSLAVQSPVPLHFDEISSKGLRATLDVQAGPALPLCTRETDASILALLFKVAELDLVGEVGACAPTTAAGLRLEVKKDKGGSTAVELIRRLGNGKDQRVSVVTLRDRSAETLERSATELKRQLQQTLIKEMRAVAQRTTVADLQMTFPPHIGLLAAKASRYEEEGVARLTITNLTDQPITGITVAGFVKGLSLLPGLATVSSLGPRASEDVPLRLNLNVPGWPRDTEPRPRVIELRVTRLAAEGLRVDKQRHMAVVYPPETIDWREPASFAAFVDDGSVAEMARAAITEMRPKGQVDTILALMAKVQSLDLEYVHDRKIYRNAGEDMVDTVQLPVETLQRHTGDCDDLSALFAALLGSVGIPTQLVVTTDHVFLLADTGVAEHRGLVPEALPQLPVLEDRRFLPVDATALTRGARDALTTSLTNWGAVAKSPDMTIVDLENAKARYGRVPSASRPPDLATIGDAPKTFDELRQKLGKLAAAQIWPNDAESRLQAATERARQNGSHTEARASLTELIRDGFPVDIRRRASHNLVILDCIERRDASCLEALLHLPGATFQAGTERARLLANLAWLHAWRGERERAVAALEASAAQDGGAAVQNWLGLPSSGRAARAGEPPAGDVRKLDAEWLRKALQTLNRPDSKVGSGSESYPLGGRRGASVSEATTVADGLYWL